MILREVQIRRSPRQAKASSIWLCHTFCYDMQLGVPAILAKVRGQVSCFDNNGVDKTFCSRFEGFLVTPGGKHHLLIHIGTAMGCFSYQRNG